MPHKCVCMYVAYIRSLALADSEVQDLFRLRSGQLRVGTGTQMGPSLTSRSSHSKSGDMRTTWHPGAPALKRPLRAWLHTWVRSRKTSLLPRRPQR